VSIAVLTFNRARHLGRLLDSLSGVVTPDVELIVVDNHSEDDTGEVVAGASIPIVYLRTEKNLGVGARNLALQRAAAEIVICLDDDVFGVDDEVIAAIRTAFATNPRLGAINFRVVDPWSGETTNWVHHCPVQKFEHATFETYEITEGAVAFRRAAVADAGWYPEYFFLSHEGPDLAFRLMEAGYSVIYRGDIAVQHWHANEGRQSWLNYYYDTRNQYWLALRNFPVRYACGYLFRGQLSTCWYALRDGYAFHWMRAVRDGVGGLWEFRHDRRTVSRDTMIAIRAIDARRPSWVYMARKRLFTKGIRL
jgi:GT2 family glycosyltransferase